MTVSGQSPVSYTYDATARLRTITQAPLNPVDLQYDAANRRTLLTLPNGVSAEYQYDSASRLTALIYRNGLSPLGDLQYGYDAAGNRRSVGGSFARTLVPEAVTTATYDAGNRQLAFGAQTFTFDDNGNRLTQTDPSGTITYTWDARNRLTAMTGPSVAASFAYDGLGRRAQKTVNSVLTQFRYDGLDAVGESTGGSDVHFLRTASIDEALVRTDATDTVHYLGDALGSSVALANAGGTLTTTYNYEPFGRTEVTGTPTPNPFRFTGREDDSIGLYYYRARYYDPGRGRFVSPDPLGFQGGALNFYAYVGNRPSTYRDALGLWTPAAHRELTREVARALGLPGADRVAQSSGREDYRGRKEGDWDAVEHAMPGSAWREHAENMLNEALGQAALGHDAEAMNALGRGVHTIQDAWAHDLRDPQGGLMEHLLGNPDDPAQNPYWWRRARDATREYLERYMRGAQLPCE
jgi:RHS repeat-associated protein